MALDQLKEEEEGEEEVLSLCDLPVHPINHANQSTKLDSHISENQEEFDFCSWSGPFSKEFKMCTADEVFFQGQILPFRPVLKTTGFKQFNRCESRSESLDHDSLSEFRSNSSRSSSLRSQNSTSSTSTNTSTTTSTTKILKTKSQNQFHPRPNPQPQPPSTVSRQQSFVNQGRKSSAWDFFRLGVVSASNLKARSTNTDLTTKVLSHQTKSQFNNVSTNSANKTTSSEVNVKISYQTNNNCGKNQRRSGNFLKQLVGKGGGIWSGCKCSVETVRSDMIMIRSGTKSSKMIESKTHAMKGKVIVELNKQKQREKQEAKKNMSRRRTFEWLKELSHDSYPDEEALLISNY